jgi:polyisoprenoid-binding protein YceI
VSRYGRRGSPFFPDESTFEQVTAIDGKVERIVPSGLPEKQPVSGRFKTRGASLRASEGFLWLGNHVWHRKYPDARRPYGILPRARPQIMKKILSIALVLSVVGYLHATDLPLDVKQSSLKFTGHAFMHDFDGEAKTFSGIAQADPQRPEIVVTATIEIQAAKMTTFETARDRNMFEWLHVDLNPGISFHLKSVKLVEGDPATATKDHPAQFAVAGEFTLNNVTKPLETSASGWREGNRLIVTGTTAINTVDHGLPIIKQFFMTVDKKVDVAFHLVFDLPAELQIPTGH